VYLLQGACYILSGPEFSREIHKREIQESEFGGVESQSLVYIYISIYTYFFLYISIYIYRVWWTTHIYV